MLAYGRIVTLPPGPGNTKSWYDFTADPTLDAGMRTTSTELAQRGLSALGALIVITIAIIALYYAYRGVTGEDEPQTCSTEFERCMQVCRRTSTDNDSAQACQSKCMSDADFCRMAEKRNK